MDAGGAAFDEAFDLLIGPIDAEHFGFFFAGVFEGVFEGLGEFGSAEVTEALGAFEIGGDHQSGDDGAVDACVLALLSKSEVVLIVIKELGGDEGGSGVDFCFEMCDVAFEIRGFGVFFGIAADTDFKLGAVFLNEGDELAGVVEAVGVGLEFGVSLSLSLGLRWVASRRHDGADAFGLVVFEEAFEFVLGVSDTGEVGHDFIAELVLERFGIIDGAGLGRSAGSVGDGDKVGIECFEGFGGFEELIGCLFAFGWKKF